MDYRLHRSLPLALNIAVVIAIVQVRHDRQHRRKLQWVAILRIHQFFWFPAVYSTYLLTYSNSLNTFSNFSLFPARSSTDNAQGKRLIQILQELIDQLKDGGVVCIAQVNLFSKPLASLLFLMIAKKNKTKMSSSKCHGRRAI
jgi:hypothetical protein